MLEMTSSEGWKVYVEQAESDLAAINEVRNIADNESLFFVKGKIEILASIIRFRDDVERQVENFEEIV